MNRIKTLTPQLDYNIHTVIIVIIDRLCSPANETRFNIVLCEILVILCIVYDCVKSCLYFNGFTFSKQKQTNRRERVR